eukprot:1136828-Pelagomonas_calceolata.AAC.4
MPPRKPSSLVRQAWLAFVLYTSTPDYPPLHAYLWFHNTYVIPAGMYASQTWASPYLQQGGEMDKCIKKWPLRACARLYNYLIHCNSPLLQKVVHAGISISSRNITCWTSHLVFATNGLHHAHGFQQRARSANPLEKIALFLHANERSLASSSLRTAAR